MAAGAPPQGIYRNASSSLIVIEDHASWVWAEDRWITFRGALHDEVRGAFADRLAGGEPPALGGRLARLPEPTRAALREALADGSWHVDEVFWDLEHLDTLFLELTAACQLACRHCYAEAEARQTSSLSAETAARVVSEAAALGFDRLQLTGGDPLLHPSCARLARQAVGLGTRHVEIYTNGLALTPTLLDALPDTVTFALSFYSADPAAHDRVTGRAGSQEATLRAIDLLVARGRVLRVGLILMPEIAAGRDETVALLEHHGVRRDRISSGQVSAVGRWRSAPFRPDVAEPPDPPPEATGRHSPPRVGFRKACVTAAGVVHPCIFARDITLGSVHDRPLEAILRAPAVQAGIPDGLDVAERFDLIASRLACADCRRLAFGLQGRMT